MNEHFNLDTPLLRLGNEELQSLTIRNTVEGIQVFGSTGSGKSSGSGKTLANKYLKAGFGGLVLTVKHDEKETWIDYCTRAGRLDDLIVIEPGGKHVFNFLDYEASRAEGAFTENIVQVLKTVIRAGEEKGSGKSDDAFWEAALDLLIFNSVDLCRLAYDTVSLQLLYDIVQSAPRPVDAAILQQVSSATQVERKKTAFEYAFDAATARVNNLTSAWIDSLPEEEAQRLVQSGKVKEAATQVIPQARLLSFVGQFFYDSYLHLADKTRSIVDYSFTTFLYRLLRDPVFSLFGKGQSTFTPEDSLDGKIILLNLPVKLYDKVGHDCQILFKYIWQRAMERRDVRQNGRPVMLWADESQNFLHEHDADFQATARSSRVATVYLTQNIPNYYAAMGGSKSEYRVKSFLGTLTTKIFHANADIETNHYASALLGNIEWEDVTRGSSVGRDFSASQNTSIKIEPAMRPEEFVSLKTGGPANDFITEAVIHRQGTPFANSLNHVIRQFKQTSDSPSNNFSTTNS